MTKTIKSLRHSAPIGLIFAVSLTIVAGIAISAFLPNYLLKRDALTIAETLAADQRSYANPQQLLADNRVVLQLIVLDAGLNVIAGGREDAIAPTFAADDALAEIASGAISAMSPRFLRVVGNDRDERIITRVLLPLPQGGMNARMLIVDVDQSQLSHLLEEGLRAALLLLLIVAAVAALIAILLGMRRAAERQATDEHIRFLALHDPLTGLPNRVQLKEHLSHALARAKRRGGQVGVLCLDLDRFKEVNDTLGHAAGDALLVSVADRLRSSLRDSDLVARLGGDEFTIVIEDPSALNDIAALARRLCRELAKPHNVSGHDFCTSASIGIAVGPLDGSNTDPLLRNADLALYRAKADGRNTYTFFEPAMDDALKERSMLEQDLRHALARNELRLAYQPQFNLNTGALCGNEALVRWEHPQRGNIAPDIFIPLAEESGLIHMIGEWVLETACRQAVAWPLGVKLAVNLSPSQFKTGDIISTIAHMLQKTGFDPHRLDLEIPETLLLDASQTAAGKLGKLRQLGVTVTIDDFGTGFSSLSHLSRFSFDRIKIDRSFVSGMRKHGDSNAIVDAIVGIGDSLGVEIAAEGIETQVQADALRDAGCIQVQGYLYGEPRDQVLSRESSVRTASQIRQTSSAA